MFLKFEFKILCNSCVARKNDPCVVSFDLLSNLGFDISKIKRVKKSNIHCVSALLKMKEDTSKEIAKKILTKSNGNIKQVIVNRKFPF